MQTTIKPICFVAGHSAGHILPAITLAQKETVPVLFISSSKPLDQQILEPHHFLQKKYFLKTSKSKYLKSFVIIAALLKSIAILRKNKPSKIVTTAGLVAVPVCIAAKLLGIPFEIYELNVEPGRATKLLTPFCSKIITCFKETQKHLPKNKCHMGIYPVRFTNKDKNLDKTKILKKLGLSPNKKTIFVLGGSQGSIGINKLISKAAPELKEFQIIHQTGVQDKFDYAKHYKALGINNFVTKYYNKMEELFTACDIVICRSGAGTLAEVIFFEKKCITIPLEAYTTIHQVDNAKAIVKEHPELVIFARQNELEDNSKKLVEIINTKI